MQINVRLFGPQAQAAYAATVAVDIDQEHATCAAVRSALSEAYPSLRASLPASRFAVNHAYASDDTEIGEQDEVALIGLVSGG